MTPPSHSNQVLGILFKVLSTLAFSAMATLVKLLSDRFPTGEIVFFRSFFALTPVLLWIAWRKDHHHIFPKHHPVLHFMRGASGTCAMFLGFTALSLLPFSDATAIGYTAPLLMVVLAVVLLGEKVRVYRWTAVGVGLFGVLVILSDYVGVGGGATERTPLGAGVAIAGTLFAATAGTLTRVLVREDTAASTVAYFSVFASAAAHDTLPFGWVMPSLPDLGLLILMGIFGGLGQVLMTTSFRLGDASTIAPFDYVSMVWALLISFFIFGTFPTVTVLAGTAIVIGAGLYVIFREHQLGIERNAARRAQTPTTPLS